MWKESYRIGIDLIDRQHMQLFLRVSLLLKAIEHRAAPEEYRKTVEFLKQYVEFHFRAEEQYQESIQFPGREAHRQAHRNFTAVVLEFERRLEDTGYHREMVKELAGTLSSWLIYHVSNTDQEIARNARRDWDDSGASVVSICADSVGETMAAVAGFDLSGIHDSRLDNGEYEADLAVEIELFGEVNGRLVFQYSREFVLGLLQNMILSRPEEIDEMACSAMAEIANISLGQAAVRLSGRGTACDIRPPRVIPGPVRLEGHGMVYGTAMGSFKLTVEMDEN